MRKKIKRKTVSANFRFFEKNFQKLKCFYLLQFSDFKVEFASFDPTSNFPFLRPSTNVSSKIVSKKNANILPFLNAFLIQVCEAEAAKPPFLSNTASQI